MSVLIRALCISGLLITLGVGCSTTDRTVKTETVTYPAGTAYPSAPVSSYQTTTTEQETTKERQGGVLSGTVDFIGEVIALPFRAVAALVSFIF